MDKDITFKEIHTVLQKLSRDGNETLVLSFNKRDGRVYTGGTKSALLFSDHHGSVSKFTNFITDMYKSEVTDLKEQCSCTVRVTSLNEITKANTQSLQKQECEGELSVTVPNYVSQQPYNHSSDNSSKQSRINGNTISESSNGSSVNHVVGNRPCDLSTVTSQDPVSEDKPDEGPPDDDEAGSPLCDDAGINISKEVEQSHSKDVDMEKERTILTRGKRRKKMTQKIIKKKQKCKKETARKYSVVTKDLKLTLRNRLRPHWKKTLDHESEKVSSKCTSGITTSVCDNKSKLKRTEKNVITCKKCEKQFATKYSLKRHMTNVHKIIIDKGHSEVTLKHVSHVSAIVEKTGNITCETCRETFTERKMFYHHARKVHKTEKPIVIRVCTICNVKFMHLSGYLRHMRSHKEMKVIKCFVCSERFASRKELEEHVTKHTISLTYSCDNCHALYKTADELKYHLENFCSEIKTKENNCNIPNANKGSKEKEKSESREVSESTKCIEIDSSTSSSLSGDKGNFTDLEEENNLKDGGEKTKVVDMKHSYNPEGHKCEKCGRKFRFAMALYKHTLLHDEKGQFPCHFCSYIAPSQDHLTRHAQIHRENSPYICKCCNKKFCDAHNLRLHMYKHTKEKSYQCEECGKCYSTVFQLRRHTRHHTGVRPHKCQYCEKTFISLETLRSHENTHTKSRTFMCDICGMVFYRKCSMYTHKKIHSDVLEHVCSKCGKKCRTVAALRTHYVSMHLTAEEVKTYQYRLYECDTCHKYFADKHDLNIHTRMHTGEKPFSCKTCSKSFADKSNLRTHEKTHLAVKPFSCNVCGKGFILKRDLLRHSKTHPEVPTRNKSSQVNQEKEQNIPEQQNQKEINEEMDHTQSSVSNKTELVVVEHVTNNTSIQVQGQVLVPAGTQYIAEGQLTLDITPSQSTGDYSIMTLQ